MNTNRQNFLTSVGIAMGSLAALPQSAQAAAPNAEAQLLDRYVAAFNAHDVDAFSSIIAESYVQHEDRVAQGLAGLQTAFHGYFRMFPDFHMEVQERTLGDGKIAALNLMTATHTQPVQLGPGTPVFAPTGKNLSWHAFDLWRVSDGKFVEHWVVQDFLALFQQMRAA